MNIPIESKISPKRKKALISLMRKAQLLGGASKELLALDALYALEGIDDKHRDKTALNIKFAEWQKLPDSPENNSFWEWLEAKYPEFSQQQGVVYLNKHERQNYRLNTQGGLIYQGNSAEPFDTTKFSGKHLGYAAYVMDKNGNIYIGEHKSGTMHHSSFLAGSSVVSAGMMKVEKGKITVINHHSGHYIPKKENLENFLLKINPNVFDDKARIKFSSEAKSKTIKKYAEFLINIRTNPQYNWLSQRILFHLTKLGHCLLSINQKKLDCYASSYYKEKLNEHNIMDKTPPSSWFIEKN